MGRTSSQRSTRLEMTKNEAAWWTDRHCRYETSNHWTGLRHIHRTDLQTTVLVSKNILSQGDIKVYGDLENSKVFTRATSP